MGGEVRRHGRERGAAVAFGGGLELAFEEAGGGPQAHSLFSF